MLGLSLFFHSLVIAVLSMFNSSGTQSTLLVPQGSLAGGLHCLMFGFGHSLNSWACGGRTYMVEDYTFHFFPIFMCENSLFILDKYGYIQSLGIPLGILITQISHVPNRPSSVPPNSSLLGRQNSLKFSAVSFLLYSHGILLPLSSVISDKLKMYIYFLINPCDICLVFSLVP